ncbi:MAG: NAD(P)H-hydrate dehydratase [Candidatus Alcyoniella australis]|nr:NAD(P)H-hydrate dehydratase [Candidatus Alcyoniella australis]
MIPAVNAEQMRELDRACIEGLGLPGVVLMENAGRACAEKALESFGDRLSRGVTILCGKGNNGGDGFVIARHLSNQGVPVGVYLFGRADDVRGDARINLDVLRAMGVKVKQITDGRGLRTLDLRVGLVVDALLGTGLQRPLSGLLAQAVQRVNGCMAPVLAVDIPSGLSSDRGALIGPCISAEVTLTFGLPKIGQLLEPGRSQCGKLEVVDISIPPEVIDRYDLCVGLLERDDFSDLFMPRPQDSNKGSYGRVAVFGSSPGLTGAVCMAGLAAARVGAGLVTCAVPRCLAPIIENKLTEVMTRPLPELDGSLCAESLDQALALARTQDVVLLGPGLGAEENARQFARDFTLRCRKPLVIDADGLNAWAGRLDELAARRGPTVLLPHPGEAGRLLGVSPDEVQADRLLAATTISERSGAVTVLKGATSIVARPEGLAAIVPTGNPGMASGGTGDVLAGMMLGMWAQWNDEFDAAAAAAYIHGMAGDRVAQRIGERALIAGDLLDELPQCLRRLEREARGEDPEN